MSITQTLKPTTAARATSVDADPLAPFDREQLVERCMGSLELAARLLDRFEQRFPIEVKEIETSWHAADSTTLARIAHRLKGAAANISAPSLRLTLQKVEDAARTNQLDQIEGCLAEVAQEWQRFVAHKAASSACAATPCAATPCATASQSCCPPQHRI